MASSGRHKRGFNYHRQIPGYEPSNLVVAIDAAVTDQRAGMGYLATDGHFGCIGHHHPADLIGSSPVVVAGLRAVYKALAVLPSEQPATVLASDEAVLRYLGSWLTGDDGLPEGYHRYCSEGRSSSLQKRIELLGQRRGQYRFEWVQANAGHPLNEAADSLAKLGLRLDKRHDRIEQARIAARSWATQRLADWHSQGK